MDEDTKRWAQKQEKIVAAEKAKGAALIRVPRDKKLSDHLRDLRDLSKSDN